MGLVAKRLITLVEGCSFQSFLFKLLSLCPTTQSFLLIILEIRPVTQMIVCSYGRTSKEAVPNQGWPQLPKSGFWELRIIDRVAALPLLRPW